MAIAKTIKILSGGAMRSLMVEIVPLFERASGTKVEIEFRLTSVLKKEIEEGLDLQAAIKAVLPAGLDEPAQGR